MITTRRALMAFLMTIAALWAVPAAAGNDPVAYSQEAFDAAQKSGKPILIDTFATWCDVCARQKPIIDKLLTDPKYKDLVTFRVDFDTQKDVMRKFNARVQSTLIVFHGSKEVGRSVGETQPEWVEDLLDKALQKGES
jgi:thiol-disulfide isomerase/thioredoxin